MPIVMATVEIVIAILPVLTDIVAIVLEIIAALVAIVLPIATVLIAKIIARAQPILQIVASLLRRAIGKLTWSLARSVAAGPVAARPIAETGKQRAPSSNTCPDCRAS
jgi:hypothetical protein